MDKQQSFKARGGSRPNSGRPNKSYRTVTVAFRVREEWKKIIQEIVRAKVAELKKGQTNA